MLRFSSIACLLGITLLIGVTTTSVSAHADYVRSTPAAEATLASAPEHVTISFSQLLEATGNSITVTDAAGAPVSAGAAERLANDQRSLRIDLRPELGPGTYTVRWQTLSAEDGESHSGEFTFTVSARDATAPTTEDADTNAPATTLPKTGMTAAISFALLGIAVLLLAGGFALHPRTGDGR